MMNDDNTARPARAHVWTRDKDDYYVEESWCSSRLFEEESFDGSILDPACGSGRIVRSAKAAGHRAYGFDKKKRSPSCVKVFDFLDPWPPGEATPQNIVSNPPFKLDRRFVDLALDRAAHKVALLLPHGFICGDSRSRWFETKPLRRVLVLTPRPSMPPGHMIENGYKPTGGKKDFAWYLFERGYDGKPEIGWLRRER